LEQKKFDPNSLSQSKETPLHKAIRGKAIRTLKILLHFGADPTLKNDQNRTPLEELDVNESLLNTRSVDKVEEEQKVCTDEIEQEAFFHRRSKTFSSDQIISFMPRPTTFNTDTTIETTQVQRFTASERNLNSDTRSSHIVGAATASATIAIAIAQKKSFKYFAKLLIRMTRVKNILSHEEKEKLIRLLLEEAIRKKRRQAELIENADENFNKTTTNCTTTTPTDTNPSRLAALGIIRSNSHRKYIIAN
jgi:ankyrin repeat protein